MLLLTDELVDTIARLAHEANAGLCRAFGDDSQPSWEDAPAWQQDSARNGVIFAIDNPDADPEASHECWMAEKRAEGWVYGEVKNATIKTHPCFVPYGDLPPEQRAKDHVFQAIARTAFAILQ